MSSAAKCCYRSHIVLDFTKRETFRRCPVHGETEHIYQPPRKTKRVPLWERWASVLVCAVIGAALVGYCVGFITYLVAACLAHRGLIAPPSWWYVVLGTACGTAAFFFAPIGWFDPPWGGVTFDARERGYA